MKLGGGVLYFPKGIYRIVTAQDLMKADVFNCAGVTIRGSNITLEGEGAGSIIQCDGNIAGTGERPWTIPIAFVWPRQDPTKSDCGNTGNILIKNLRFRANVSPVPMTYLNYNTDGSPGTYFPEVGTGTLLAFQGTETTWATGIRIVNCIFEDGNKAPAVYPAFVDNVVFEGCTFTCNKNYALGTRVKCATTGNIGSLVGEQTIDTINVFSGDRVLVKNQADATQNGIYLVRSGSTPSGDWIRADDADDGLKLENLMVFVEQGYYNKQRIFQTRTNASPIILTAPTSPLFPDKSEIRFYEYFVAQAASSTNVTITSPGATIDSRTIQIGDLVLLYGQTSSSQNGVYEFRGPTTEMPRMSVASNNANVLAFVRDGETHNRKYFRGSVSDSFSEVASSEIQGHPISFRAIKFASQVNQSNPSTRNDLSGVSLAVGNTFLLTNQDDPKENGLYMHTANGSNERIYKDDQRMQNLHVTIEQNAGTANPHQGWQFACMTPPNVEYDSNTPPKPLFAILFYRAHNFYWAARAASPLTPGSTGSNVTRSGISSLDGVTLKDGDIVLLKSQTTASENGAYRVRSGAWESFPLDTNNGFGIYVANGATKTNKNNVFYNAGWVFATGQTDKWYKATENGWPQIKAAAPSGTIAMIGNQCDGDFIGIGGDRGADGLFFHLANHTTIANGNGIRNFRFEAIQTVSLITECVGNTFFTTKGGATVALQLTPTATYFKEFSVTLTGNVVDGAVLYRTFISTTPENLVEIDPTIVGNSVNASRSYGLSPIIIERGRKVTLANNKIRNAWDSAIRASSCTTQVTVTVASTTQFTVTASDTIKTGERIVFSQDGSTPVPGLLSTLKDYYAKRVNDTRIEVYNDVDLTSGPVNLGASAVACILHHRLNSIFTATGNEISDPKPGWTSNAIHLNDALGLAGKKAFGQTIIADNVLGARAKHIYALKPLAGVMNFMVGENVYTTEQGVQTSAVIDLTTASGTVYGWYEIQGKVLNGAPNRTWAGAIADVYVKDGKTAKLFSAAGGTMVYAHFNPTSTTPVELFRNYSDQRMLLIELGFIRLAIQSITPKTNGDPVIGRIVVRSKHAFQTWPSTYVSAVDIATFNSLGNYNPKVAERDLYYASGSTDPVYCVGGFFHTGEGLEIIGTTGDKTQALPDPFVAAAAQSSPKIMVYARLIVQPEIVPPI